MSYWSEFNRITKRFEKKYGAKMNKALRAQVNTYLRTNRLDSIKSDQIYNILKDMYAEVGVNWAFNSGKYLRVKKARRPLGFTERIIQMLQSQYTTDLLNMANDITETTKKRIRNVLNDAVREGWSITEITNKIQAPEVDAMRARLIARTEVIGAANAGAMVNAQDLGATKKIWIAAIDSRTRNDHRKLDGKKVEINEYFTVVDKNGVTRKMMQPGDKTGGPGQVCNCRCAVGFE